MSAEIQKYNLTPISEQTSDDQIIVIPQKGKMNGFKIAALSVSGVGAIVSLTAVVVASIFAFYLVIAAAAFACIGFVTLSALTYKIKTKDSEQRLLANRLVPIENPNEINIPEENIVIQQAQNQPGRDLDLNSANHQGDVSEESTNEKKQEESEPLLNQTTESLITPPINQELNTSFDIPPPPPPLPTFNLHGRKKATESSLPAVEEMNPAQEEASSSEEKSLDRPAVITVSDIPPPPPLNLHGMKKTTEVSFSSVEEMNPTQSQTPSTSSEEESIDYQIATVDLPVSQEIDSFEKEVFDQMDKLALKNVEKRARRIFWAAKREQEAAELTREEERRKKIIAALDNPNFDDLSIEQSKEESFKSKTDDELYDETLEIIAEKLKAKHIERQNSQSTDSNTITSDLLSEVQLKKVTREEAKTSTGGNDLHQAILAGVNLKKSAPMAPKPESSQTGLVGYLGGILDKRRIIMREEPEEEKDPEKDKDWD